MKTITIKANRINMDDVKKLERQGFTVLIIITQKGE
jgi:hypothetical protein